MIKVLEHGLLKVTCPNCKAKLQYEIDDIKYGTKRDSNDDFLNEVIYFNYIICPDCNTKIEVKR